MDQNQSSAMRVPESERKHLCLCSNHYPYVLEKPNKRQIAWQPNYNESVAHISVWTARSQALP